MLTFSFGVTLYFIGMMVRVLYHNHSGPKIFGGIVALSITAVWFLQIRWRIKQLRSAEPVVPLTCANIVHLPASDSLVRASSEPVHDQQTELLRAAVETQATPAEQLLRPANEI